MLTRNKPLFRAFQESQRQRRINALSSPTSIEEVSKRSQEYVKNEVFEKFRNQVMSLIQSEMIENTANLETSLNTAIEEAKSSLISEIDKAVRGADHLVSQRLKEMRAEVDSLISDLEKIKMEKTPVIPAHWLRELKSLIVQRSLSIPVAVDEGGTGLTTNNYHYFGGSPSAPVSGMWRFSLSGTDLIAERYEAGAWVNKGGFTA